MTTKLTRRVVRETGCRHQGRTILILLEVGGRVVRVKQKGRRKWYSTTVEAIYWQAVKNESAAIKAAKALKRLERQRERKAARS